MVTLFPMYRYWQGTECSLSLDPLVTKTERSSDLPLKTVDPEDGTRKKVYFWSSVPNDWSKVVLTERKLVTRYIVKHCCSWTTRSVILATVGKNGNQTIRMPVSTYTAPALMALCITCTLLMYHIPYLFLYTLCMFKLTCIPCGEYQRCFVYVYI